MLSKNAEKSKVISNTWSINFFFNEFSHYYFYKLYIEVHKIIN